jgi:hypothetical protein
MHLEFMTMLEEIELKKEVGLFLLGWFSSLIPQLMNRDLLAKEKCLQSLCDMQELLEKSRNVAYSGSGSEAKYHDFLLEIKKLAKKLRIEKIGLVIPSYPLDKCLIETLIVLNKYDPQHQNLAFHSAQTLVMVQLIWGSEGGRRIEFYKVDDIQQELSHSFFHRIAKWPILFCKKLVRRIPKRDKTTHAPGQDPAS